MRLINQDGQIHDVTIKVASCDVIVTRREVGTITLQFDLTIGFVEGLNKIKRVVEMPDELFTTLSAI